MIASILCGICKISFHLKNTFHKHFRNDNCLQYFYLTDSFTNSSKKLYTIFKIFSKQFLIIVTSLTILFSKFNFNQDIDINYDFKDWQYVITQLTLAENASFNLKCVGFEAAITLVDTVFLEAQIKDRVSLKIMTTFISTRKFDVSKHFTNKYAIVSLYFE